MNLGEEFVVLEDGGGADHARPGGGEVDEGRPRAEAEGGRGSRQLAADHRQGAHDEEDGGRVEGRRRGGEVRRRDGFLEGLQRERAGQVLPHQLDDVPSFQFNMREVKGE